MSSPLRILSASLILLLTACTAARGGRGGSKDTAEPSASEDAAGQSDTAAGEDGDTVTPADTTPADTGAEDTSGLSDAIAADDAAGADDTGPAADDTGPAVDDTSAADDTGSAGDVGDVSLEDAAEPTPDADPGLSDTPAPEDVADPDTAGADTDDPDVGLGCGETPSCTCVLGECASSLGVPAELGCSALEGSPECIGALLAAYATQQCGEACGSASTTVWSVLCVAPECEAMLGALANFGLLGSNCEECSGCTPSCDGKACGPDGCGGSCGTCAEGSSCTDAGTCTPATIPTTCADVHGTIGCCFDGDLFWFENGVLQGGAESCGALSCGWDAADGYYACKQAGADPSGKYPIDCFGENPAPETCPVCSCEGKKCGDDGCGGSCGTCAEGTSCTDAGTCTPATTPTTCADVHGTIGCCFDGDLFYFENGVLQGGAESCGAVCGWDAAGGYYSCEFEGADPSGKYPIDCFGENPASETCPVCSCEGKNCGDDGCGGSCGTCGEGMKCGPEGQCADPGMLQCKLKTECAAVDACECVTCVSDGICNSQDDCICADCATDSFCSNAANCEGDGVCDMYNEGCVCSDCAKHPSCGG